jgi:DNA-binding winged helix-turn-helix (wHTH) protein
VHVRFVGFELDERRAELRRPDGDVVKLRPKTLAILCLFTANAGRVLSKQALMDAVWPNVHDFPVVLYNAVIMQYTNCFANNNNDSDDPRIVGRSFAG